MTALLSVAVDQCPADLEGPEARLSWLRSILADMQGNTPDLLVLPELFQCGYNIGERIASAAEPANGAFAEAVASLVRKHAMAILYGYAEREGEHLYNAAQCIDKQGNVLGKHRKLLLPPGFEGDQFTQGDDCELFELAGFKIATLICYDVEFPENLRHVVSQGADIVVVPTALGAQWGIVADKVVPTRAFENGVFLCYANYCGYENGLAYYGGSCIVSPHGEVLAKAGHNTELISAQLMLDEVQQARKRLPYQDDRTRLPWGY